MYRIPQHTGPSFFKQSEGLCILVYMSSKYYLSPMRKDILRKSSAFLLLKLGIRQYHYSAMIPSHVIVSPACHPRLHKDIGCYQLKLCSPSVFGGRKQERSFLPEALSHKLLNILYLFFRIQGLDPIGTVNDCSISIYVLRCIPGITGRLSFVITGKEYPLIFKAELIPESPSAVSAPSEANIKPLIYPYLPAGVLHSRYIRCILQSQTIPVSDHIQCRSRSIYPAGKPLSEKPA